MDAPDLDFERRWTAWKNHGVAAERTAQKVLFTLVAAIGAALVIAIAYNLLTA
jgi:hypothetical protein